MVPADQIIVVPADPQKVTEQGELQGDKPNYLYVEYLEKQKEPTPAPGGTATDDKDSCNYGRVSEQYKLSISQTPPVRQRTLLMEEGGVTYWYLFGLGPDSIDTYIGTLNSGAPLSGTPLDKRFLDHWLRTYFGSQTGSRRSWKQVEDSR